MRETLILEVIFETFIENLRQLTKRAHPETARYIHTTKK